MKHKHILGGAFIVAGTSIGAGMLALPVVTAEGGFFPAIVIYLFCWLFMTCTGLLFLEICLHMPKDANIISMATHYLGRGGRFFAWILYFFLFYNLSIAYISGGGGLISQLSQNRLPEWSSAIIFVLVLSPFVYLGAKFVDRINLLLMAGLVISFLSFMFFGFEHVQIDFLKLRKWTPAFFALPVIFTSFAYQGVIPSLTAYLKRDPKSVRYSILLGTTLAFVIYVIWEFLILGIVPVEGDQGLALARLKGETAIQPLKFYTKVPIIYALGQFFAFFAMTTSFLGVTLGLFDFIADGFKIPKRGTKKVLIALITFLPPLVVAMVNPGIFLIALSYAGGIGCAVLLGFFPALMVWVARYVKKEVLPEKRQLFGGKFLLSLFFAFVVFELVIEFLQEYIRLK